MPRARHVGSRRRPTAADRAPSRARWLVGAVLFLVAALQLCGVSPARADPSATAVPGALADSTSLTMNANLVGLTALSVTGSLTSATGTPMSDGLISITLDDLLVGHATTGADGRWSATIPLAETLPAGPHRVVALFLDTASGGDVSASATVQKGTLAATRISATGSATRVGRHQVLTVSGRLTTTTGHPVAAAVITVGTPDASGTITTGVTGDDGRFVIDYDVHENAGQQPIPVRFDGDASGRSSSTSVTVTVTDKPVASPSPSPAPTASVRAISDSGPGDAQPADPPTPLPPKPGSDLTSGPLTSGPHLAFGGVGLLALLTSLAMLGRSLSPRRPTDERVRLIDR